MTEQEIIDKFSLFGYEIIKIKGRYHLFDRRNGIRFNEQDSLESLIKYAETYYAFDFMTETLQKTIDAFKRIYGLIPDEPETVTGDEEQQDPEQEQETSPVSPVTDQDQKPAPEPAKKDSPTLYTKVCKGCGRQFQTAHKQSMYCSKECYPSNKEKQSQTAETAERPVAVMPRPF